LRQNPEMEERIDLVIATRLGPKNEKYYYINLSPTPEGGVDIWPDVSMSQNQWLLILRKAQKGLQLLQAAKEVGFRGVSADRVCDKTDPSDDPFLEPLLSEAQRNAIKAGLGSELCKCIPPKDNYLYMLKLLDLALGSN